MTSTQPETALTRARRKTREGVVVSDKMEKTRIVLVQEQKPHALYKKVVRINRRFKVHDETNESGVGDRVRITETRPLSREKRWRIAKVLEKAK
jgi:small subunit ribosomal protein S17